MSGPIARDRLSSRGATSMPETSAMNELLDEEKRLTLRWLEIEQYLLMINDGRTVPHPGPVVIEARLLEEQEYVEIALAKLAAEREARGNA